MKKTYIKPDLETVCFELNEDIVTASGESKDVLDYANDAFEKAADGILDFFNGLGG
ncbi:MAG: hypothetical protein IJU96_02835 [Clostridia bacterium]|nr:hypothetical protein [Clostridia bacterium]